MYYDVLFRLTTVQLEHTRYRLGGNDMYEGRRRDSNKHERNDYRYIVEERDKSTRGQQDEGPG